MPVPFTFTSTEEGIASSEGTSNIAIFNRKNNVLKKQPERCCFMNNFRETQATLKTLLARSSNKLLQLERRIVVRVTVYRNCRVKILKMKFNPVSSKMCIVPRINYCKVKRKRKQRLPQKVNER